jgi:hypothetical protein
VSATNTGSEKNSLKSHCDYIGERKDGGEEEDHRQDPPSQREQSRPVLLCCYFSTFLKKGQKRMNAIRPCRFFTRHKYTLTTNNRKDFDLPTMTISKVTCSEPKPLTPANNKQQKKKGIC